MSSQITKTVEVYTAQRVTLSSKKATKDVLAALDVEVNKEGAGVVIMRLLATAESKEEIEKGMKELTDSGKRDFVYVPLDTPIRAISDPHT